MAGIRIIAIGKEKDPWVTAGCEHYLTLLSRWVAVHFVQIPRTGKLRQLENPSLVREHEATLLEKSIDGAYAVVLTDTGTAHDSHGFARTLAQWEQKARGELCFVIGGPFGLHDRVLSCARARLSLSNLTFGHQIARIVLLEQLYRGYSIRHGTDYHK